MKVALMHDWLTGIRGGEKVLEAICEVLPAADLYTLVYEAGSTNATIENRTIKTSLLQKVPRATRNYRYFLPVLPVFPELMNFDEYDLVVSSSHAVAKNIRVRPDAKHISYIHSPMRYIWDMFDEYFDRYFQGLPGPLYQVSNITIRNLIRPWRWWDKRTAQRIDQIVTNSDFVGQRVASFYQKNYTVINPPVDVADFTPAPNIEKEDYYIVVSALVPYKRVDLVIEAFNRSGRRLIVIGKGPLMDKFQAMAQANVELTGYLEKQTMIDILQRARGFVYPQIEDFGITAVEAQAAGTPVIAYDRGGARETVIDGNTGLFFPHQTIESINQTIDRFEQLDLRPSELMAHAERFNKERFKQEFREFIAKTMSS